MFGLFDYLKVAAGIIIGAALTFVPACQYGKNQERSAAQIAAAKEAVKRVQNLEKNNAEFNKLSGRDRCLAFMRDSGLHSENCDP